MERDSEAPSAGDQNERNSSPVPERFPPGELSVLISVTPSIFCYPSPLILEQF